MATQLSPSRYPKSESMLFSSSVFSSSVSSSVFAYNRDV
ncbi:hypothetical protein TMEN_4002 [Trichophyton mentagrophytes]|nr:hypothetical protein TMEN_4002 [Trichophyton mentagrophytes]